MTKSKTPVACDDLRAFSGPEVCARLDISPRTLTRLLDREELTTVSPRKRGKAVRISAASLRRYLEGGA